MISTVKAEHKVIFQNKILHSSKFCYSAQWVFVITQLLCSMKKTHHQTCSYVVITLKSDFLSSVGVSDDVLGHKVVVSAQEVRRTSSTLLFEYITYCAVLS